jgi:glycosyltransferase involved in cell wall biosynthesis
MSPMSSAALASESGSVHGPPDTRKGAPRYRVALFVNSIAMGGVEEHVRQIAVGLAERGLEVVLVCPESDEISPLAHACTAAGVQVERLTLSLHTGASGAFTRLLRLVRLLRAAKVDVLHLHLIGYTGGRWAVLAGKLARVPALITTVHIAPSGPESLRVMLERRIINLMVDRFIAVSRVTQERQIRYLHQSAHKTVVIPNAVELSRYRDVPKASREFILRKQGIPRDAAVIGCVARLSEGKGLNYLIDAMPDIVARVPRAHALLVGDGPSRADLERQASALGVRDRVHFAGYHQDIPAWLAAMDVFLLPSLSEALPLSILEAMAAGLPIVATAVGGIPEAVEDGLNGLLIPIMDARALSTAVVEVLSNAAHAKQMGLAGRARAELYSDAILIERLLKLYGEAL